jgi:hypothetical protein
MLKPPAARSLSDSRAARLSIEIPADLASAIHKVALDLRVTSFVLLLSAQYVMLARWCGLDDITIGTVTHGRDAPALQGVVGYLADREYYRTSLAGNPDFIEIVQRVMATMRDAARHQFVPSDIVKHIAGGAAKCIHAPIFNYLPYIGAGQGMPSNDSPAPFPVAPPPAQSAASPDMCYWLALHENVDGLRGHFRFGGPVVEALPATYVSVLTQAVAAPKRKLGSFWLHS